MGGDAIEAALRQQAHWCQLMGSPLNGTLLQAAADDYERGGIVRALLRDFAQEPNDSALALRLAGALHHAVLTGRAGSLADHYPSVGGSFDAARGAALWGAAEAVLADDPDTIRSFLVHPPQTNEVARSGVLLGGFLTIAERTGLPLALLEVGASAGLNLLWEKFRYDLEVGAWGNPDSPVAIHCLWRGQPPSLGRRPEVVSKAGCDRHPLPIATPADALRLEAYVWPDQTARLERLRGAIELARAETPAVEQADAATWLAATLDVQRVGQVTVVYHSIVMQYLDTVTREHFEDTLEAAGERATPEAPLAHLAMEPGLEQGRPMHALELTLWPGGRGRRLARVHPHGAEANWLPCPG